MRNKQLTYVFDYLFYVIFSYYYDRGRVNEKHYPPLGKTYFHFVIFFLSFSLFIYHFICFRVPATSLPISPWGSSPAIHVFVMMAFTYIFFFYRKRYNKIYLFFLESKFANSRAGKALGWSGYFLGFISFLAIAYLKGKIIH